LIPQDAGHCHRLERGADDVRRTRPVSVVESFRFEQLRVRQDDPKLIVEAMQESAKIAELGGIVATFDHFHG
jgi:hypothetical protein